MISNIGCPSISSAAHLALLAQPFARCCPRPITPFPQPLATPRTVYFAPIMTVLTLEQGLTLAALPYSFWISSISSVDRLRAAQKTFGPTDPIKDEEDKPSKIKKVVVGVVIFTAYIALLMGINRLPAWALEEGMAALAALLLSVPAIVSEALTAAPDPHSLPTPLSVFQELHRDPRSL